jgi:hypothetical protein
MSLSAREAREAADTYYNGLVKTHAKEYKAMKAAERRKINEMKKNGHWDEIIANIEDHVKRISAKGGRSLEELEYMAFYLHGEDTILYEDLMNYFRGQGYTIKQYANCGIQLQW